MDLKPVPGCPMCEQLGMVCATHLTQPPTAPVPDGHTRVIAMTVSRALYDSYHHGSASAFISSGITPVLGLTIAVGDILMLIGSPSATSAHKQSYTSWMARAVRRVDGDDYIPGLRPGWRLIHTRSLSLWERNDYRDLLKEHNTALRAAALPEGQFSVPTYISPPAKEKRELKRNAPATGP